MVGYFTAGVMMLLGVLLITKYGREMKLCYVAGGVFIILGVWWVLNTMYPEHPIIGGWLGWVVKGVALLCCFLQLRREACRRKAVARAHRTVTKEETHLPAA